jgi:hypothetical protein
MESIRARFARTNLHWPHDLASVQGNTIEIRLNPAGPGQICENYLDAIQLLHDSCADSGITLFPGNGHWHFSLNQGGKNCFKTLYDAGSLARLETAVCGSICDFQELLPALFVKPNIAEKDPLRGHGGPTDFMRGGSPSSSIRSSFDHYTWEPRLALHAPYQPVYLTLLSLRQAFTGDGGKIVSYDDPAYDGRVLRGTGGYLGMIRETLRTIDAHPALIPRPIALALLRESIRDYETYLAGPRAQLTMKPDAIAEIRENLRPIETLCAPAKIPSPAAPNL